MKIKVRKKLEKAASKGLFKALKKGRGTVALEISQVLFNIRRMFVEKN